MNKRTLPLWFLSFYFSAASIFAVELHDEFPISTFRKFEEGLPIHNMEKKVAMPEQLKALENAERHSFSLSRSNIPLSVRAVYTGKFRKIDAIKRRFLEFWNNSIARGRAAELFSFYDFEVKVAEGKNFRWIPVQTSFLQNLKDEAQIGKEGLFFVRYYGVCDSQAVYLMVEFDVQASP